MFRQDCLNPKLSDMRTPRYIPSSIAQTPMLQSEFSEAKRIFIKNRAAHPQCQPALCNKENKLKYEQLDFSRNFLTQNRCTETNQLELVSGRPPAGIRPICERKCIYFDGGYLSLLWKLSGGIKMNELEI